MKLDAKHNHKKKKNNNDGYEMDQGGGNVEMKIIKQQKRKTEIVFSPEDRSLDAERFKRLKDEGESSPNAAARLISEKQQDIGNGIQKINEAAQKKGMSRSSKSLYV